MPGRRREEEEVESSDEEGQDELQSNNAHSNEGFIEFEDEVKEEKALTGRRLKRKKELQKKMKTGTFGTCSARFRTGRRLPSFFESMLLKACF
jgi:RNA polymerase-binding transcription factor DksA